MEEDFQKFLMKRLESCVETLEYNSQEKLRKADFSKLPEEQHNDVLPTF